MFRSLGRAGLAWRSLALALGRGAVWGPLCIVALARFASVLVLASFHSPWLAPFAVPLVDWLGGEEATHYPRHMLALPSMFAQVEQLIAVLIASVALGASVVGFAVCFTRRSLAPAWEVALRSAPHLMLLSLLVVGLTAASGAFLGHILPAVLPDGLASLAVSVAVLGISVLLQALLAYSIAAIVLSRRRILGAIRMSIGLARRNPLTTLLLVGVPAFLLQLMSFALTRWNPIERGIAPEWITVGLGLQILFELLLAFVVLGSTTRVFLSRVTLAS